MQTVCSFQLFKFWSLSFVFWFLALHRSSINFSLRRVDVRAKLQLKLTLVKYFLLGSLKRFYLSRSSSRAKMLREINFSPSISRDRRENPGKLFSGFPSGFSEEILDKSRAENSGDVSSRRIFRARAQLWLAHFVRSHRFVRGRILKIRGIWTTFSRCAEKCVFSLRENPFFAHFVRSKILSIESYFCKNYKFLRNLLFFINL
mgnify:CR=1 FL=1